MNTYVQDKNKIILNTEKSEVGIYNENQQNRKVERNIGQSYWFGQQYGPDLIFLCIIFCDIK